MADGWDGINEIGRADDASPDPDAPLPNELVDKLYADVFNTPAGLKLLAHWREHYLDKPVCVPGAGADFGYHREGQNDLVRECRRRLINGTKPKT